MTTIHGIKLHPEYRRFKPANPAKAFSQTIERVLENHRPSGHPRTYHGPENPDLCVMIVDFP